MPVVLRSGGRTRVSGSTWRSVNRRSRRLNRWWDLGRFRWYEVSSCGIDIRCWSGRSRSCSFALMDLLSHGLLLRWVLSLRLHHRRRWTGGWTSVGSQIFLSRGAIVSRRAEGSSLSSRSRWNSLHRISVVSECRSQNEASRKTHEIRSLIRRRRSVNLSRLALT